MNNPPDASTATLGTEEHLAGLLEIRRRLLEATADAASPAVARALDMADTYLFLAISYLGYSDDLYPEEALRQCLP